MNIAIVSVLLSGALLGCADRVQSPHLGAHLAGAHRGDDVSPDEAGRALRDVLGSVADELEILETARYGPLLAGMARVDRGPGNPSPITELLTLADDQPTDRIVRTFDQGDGSVTILAGNGSATVFLSEEEDLLWFQGPASFAYMAVGELKGPAPLGETRPLRFEVPYDVGVRFGDLGPRLVELGVLDPILLERAYLDAGRPLSDAQRAVLAGDTDATVRFAPGEERFLLDFFWAVGLANRTRFLTEGPMMRNGKEGVTRFASTGGWRFGRKPVAEVYASAELVTLTREQTERLERVAQRVYRPCCDNPTAFPDCNHGMAMLGLLTLLASDDAGEARLLEAARHANLFWYPAQMLQVVHFLNAALGPDRAGADPSLATGPEVFSGSGFRGARGWLAGQGMLVGTGTQGMESLAC